MRHKRYAGGHFSERIHINIKVIKEEQLEENMRHDGDKGDHLRIT